MSEPNEKLLKAAENIVRYLKDAEDGFYIKTGDPLHENLRVAVENVKALHDE